MDEYIQNYENYQVKLVYDFKLNCGGIGDCIRFFIYALNISIKNKYQLYYLANNIPIENYILLKYKKMQIKKEELGDVVILDSINSISNIIDNKYYIITPFIFYNYFIDNNNINIDDVFIFSDEVKLNVSSLLIGNISQYVSIHLRLGDKHLETDKSFVFCYTDERIYDENSLFKCIEENYDKNIIFFCDNNNYKLKIKLKYNNIIITSCKIGHTGLLNTTNEQILDTVTEFYLLTNSEKIYSCSTSGFSLLASKFKNIPYILI
jgi:hypothetical protein